MGVYWHCEVMSKKVYLAPHTTGKVRFKVRNFEKNRQIPNFVFKLHSEKIGQLKIISPLVHLNSSGCFSVCIENIRSQGFAFRKGRIFGTIQGLASCELPRGVT